MNVPGAIDQTHLAQSKILKGFQPFNYSLIPSNPPDHDGRYQSNGYPDLKNMGFNKFQNNIFQGLGLGWRYFFQGFFGRVVHAKDGLKMGGDAIFTGNGPINNVSNTTLSTKVTANIFG